MENKIKDKNKRFKELMTCTEEEDRIEKRQLYTEVKQATKKSVTKAKSRAYKDFY